MNRRRVGNSGRGASALVLIAGLAMAAGAAAEEPTSAPAGASAPAEASPSAAASESISASVASAVATAPAKRSYKAVLYDLKGADIQREHLEMVEASLLVEMRKLRGVAAIGMVEVRAMLSAEEARQISGCAADEKCISAIAGALGADFLIMGSVGRVGDSTVFSLKRLDMLTAEVTQTVAKRMRGGGGEELLEAIGPAVEELFPEFEPRPGLSRGVATELVARWDPPPIPPWLTYTAGGTAAALTVVALAALIQQKVAESDYGNLVTQSTVKAVSGRNLVAAESTAKSSYDVMVVASSLAAATWAAAGVLFLFTDWAGEAGVRPQVGVVPGKAVQLGLGGRF